MKKLSNSTMVSLLSIIKWKNEILYALSYVTVLYEIENALPFIATNIYWYHAVILFFLLYTIKIIIDSLLKRFSELLIEYICKLVVIIFRLIWFMGGNIVAFLLCHLLMRWIEDKYGIIVSIDSGNMTMTHIVDYCSNMTLMERDYLSDMFSSIVRSK